MLQLAQAFRLSRTGASRCAGAWRSFSAQVGDDLPSHKTDIQVAGGSPPIAAGRKVIIFSPSRVAGQHGNAQTIDGGGPSWKVLFAPESKWINPLMGWTSTGDALENVHRPLYFDSKEAAIAFAVKNGWGFEVEDPNPRKHVRPTRFLGYGDNYSVKRKGIPSGGLRSELVTKKGKK